MAGLVVAFKQFNIVDGVFRSPWSGLDNFRFFFSSGDAAHVHSPFGGQGTSGGGNPVAFFE